ncbi:MAG: preprotein translocase subunit SecG [Spirochaetaceae bacterium]|jgi:preprotein translocase subunit SecG|nr:preprotein translocase subunit SecG [Spirochaetaceae bacterium]
MGVIATILIVLFVIVSLLLVILVLIQDEQGDSIGGIFGGSSTSTFGASSSSVLGKITRVFGASFIVLSLLVAFFLKSPSNDGVMGAARQLEQQDDWWKQDTQLPEEVGSELVIPE